MASCSIDFATDAIYSTSSPTLTEAELTEGTTIEFPALMEFTEAIRSGQVRIIIEPTPPRSHVRISRYRYQGGGTWVYVEPNEK